jgi:hypothetical protein
LKIFKHYKLKPSFSTIKDNKAKEKGRGGGQAPTPNFGRSINPNLIQFEPILSDMNQIINLIILIQFEPILSDLNFQK